MAEEGGEKEVENTGNETETPDIESKAQELGTDAETLQKAMDSGYDPDFEGNDNKRAIGPEEFLDRQQLYDDLRKRGRENKKLQKAVDELRESHKVVAQQAYKRAKRELEREKKEAYEEGDTDRALEIDKEMNDLDKDQEKVSSSDDNTQAVTEAFENFRSENPWYEKDAELRGYADMVGQGMIQMNPEKARNDPDALFEEVAAEVRRRFPDKFGDSKGNGKKRGNSVEGDTGSKGGKGKKRSLKDLPEEHREVAKRVVETGVMTEEEYVKDYFGTE